MTALPVFKPDDWAQTAPGVWEATSAPSTPGQRPPFEATCRTALADTNGTPTWWWTLYRPNKNSPYGDLDTLSSGPAQTLAEAKRQVDAHARDWRDTPAHMQAESSLCRYTEHSLVTCDECGATYQLGHILPRTSCGGTNGEPCLSEWFDGYHLDRLAEAVTQ